MLSDRELMKQARRIELAKTILEFCPKNILEIENNDGFWIYELSSSALNDYKQKAEEIIMMIDNIRLLDNLKKIK